MSGVWQIVSPGNIRLLDEYGSLVQVLAPAVLVPAEVPVVLAEAEIEAPAELSAFPLVEDLACKPPPCLSFHGREDSLPWCQ